LPPVVDGVAGAEDEGSGVGVHDPTAGGAFELAGRKIGLNHELGDELGLDDRGVVFGEADDG
jgi:hypothetical protein